MGRDAGTPGIHRQYVKEKIMESIKQILMRRDRMSADEAEDLIAQAKAYLAERLDDDVSDELPFDICEEWFGLEPDYLEQLLH